MGLGQASASSASLAPGFRFHPTDEELVSYYLKRKVCGKPFRFDAISDIDVYKSEPWDLPDKSRLKSKDLEWYFFSVLDKKYGNGSRTNRATERGYWKTTGKDRAVLHRSRMVGMKKTLVYHSGRAPRGERSNWVMHEYRLVDETLETSGIFQDAFVLCRIFQKSGSGPKNGEQYGAPFVEEEWENDELVMVPGEEARGEEVDSDDVYLYENDIEQIVDADVTLRDVPLPSILHYEDNSTNLSDPLDLVNDAQNPSVSVDESNSAPDQPDDEKFLNFPVENNNMDTIPVNQEYVGESSNIVDSVDPDYLLDEPFFDVANNPNDKMEYLETNDLYTIEADLSYLDMVEEYLTFYDADDDNLQFMGVDSLDMMGSENLLSYQSSLTQQHLSGESQQETVGSQQPSQELDDDVASSSKHELGSDTRPSLVKKANHVLGSIPAPPAFASEFPTKESALLLHSAFHASSPAHIRSGMIEISNAAMSGGNRPYWSFGKDASVNIVLSFGMPPNDLNATKTGPAVPRCWLYLLFVWVLILSLSCRIGNYICSRNAA